jgi:ATP-dependent Zn protease
LPEFVEERSTAIRVGSLGIPGSATVRINDQSLDIRTQVVTWKKELLNVPLTDVHSVRIASNGIDANCEVTLRDRDEKYLFTSSEPEKLIAFLRGRKIDVNVESLPNPKAASLFRKAEKAWIFVAGTLAVFLGLFFLAVFFAWITAKG